MVVCVLSRRARNINTGKVKNQRNSLQPLTLSLSPCFWISDIPSVIPGAPRQTYGGPDTTWQTVMRRSDKYYGKRTVEAYLHRSEFELYDLEKDPDEVKNLAENPKYAKVLAELKEKLKVFQKRTKDPWIIKWQYE